LVSLDLGDAEKVNPMVNRVPARARLPAMRHFKACCVPIGGAAPHGVADAAVQHFVCSARLPGKAAKAQTHILYACGDFM
jgi:hypothetical protein